MPIRALSFDYGGTLDGPASHWLDRFVGLYRAAAVEVPFDRLKDAYYRADEAVYATAWIRGASLRKLIEFHVQIQLTELGLDDAALQRRLADDFVAASQSALAASRSVLARLAGRFRLGVVSNFYGNVDRILAEAGIAPLLTVIVDSTVVGLSKPDVRIFEHAVAALGAQPAETMHVGDSYERDIVAAHAAGLHTAWLVPDGEATPAPPSCVADVRLGSLHELLAHLDAG